MERYQVQLEVFPHGEDLELPRYATPGSSGLDLRAANRDPVVLPPLGRSLLPTGVAVALPTGLEGQVRPRSGLALERGLTVLNSPGTIDSDYRGEIMVLLVNFSDVEQVVRRGERIAQLVCSPVASVDLQSMSELDATERGGGAFGSTGER